MSLSTAQLEYLAERGLTIHDVIELSRLGEVEPTQDAVRQARYRGRRDVSAAEWEAIRHQIFERDGYVCQYCGSDDRIACDHIVPLIQGGKSVPDNLTTACKSCNSSKSGRSLEEWLA